jgi:hypothetical protein
MAMVAEPFAHGVAGPGRTATRALRPVGWAVRGRVRQRPALEDPSRAEKYCARYSRRPAPGEARIEKYDGQHGTFRCS